MYCKKLGYHRARLFSSEQDMHYRGWASQCNEEDKALACRFSLQLKNKASCLCISIMVILAMNLSLKPKGGADT